MNYLVNLSTCCASGGTGVELSFSVGNTGCFFSSARSIKFIIGSDLGTTCGVTFSSGIIAGAVLKYLLEIGFLLLLILLLEHGILSFLYSLDLYGCFTCFCLSLWSVMIWEIVLGGGISLFSSFCGFLLWQEIHWRKFSDNQPTNVRP